MVIKANPLLLILALCLQFLIDHVRKVIFEMFNVTVSINNGPCCTSNFFFVPEIIDLNFININ